MLYVGIDQHRQQLTVPVRDDRGEVVLRRQVSTQWDKVRAFLDDLNARAAPMAGYFAIVEVCGFNDWLLQHLRARQPVCCQVFLIQPEKQSSHKTDRRDAAGLSEPLWLNRERLLARLPARGLRVVGQPSAEDLFDRRLTSRRVVSSHDLTRTINRIKERDSRDSPKPRPRATRVGIPLLDDLGAYAPQHFAVRGYAVFSDSLPAGAGPFLCQ